MLAGEELAGCPLIQSTIAEPYRSMATPIQKVATKITSSVKVIPLFFTSVLLAATELAVNHQHLSSKLKQVLLASVDRCLRA